MADEAVRVEGAQTLQATLGAAAVRLRHLRPVNDDIAVYTARQARAYAPVRSGRLRRSITPSATSQTAVVSSDLIYAAVQENGWPGHGITPHRFMARASDDAEPRAIAEHLDNVNDILRTVKGA